MLSGYGGVDGAIVVDLKNFQQFSMDNSAYIATIGAGTLLGDVTTRLHNAGGRAMAHGTCPQVGIGGHATIGGLGPTSRQWGSALDHIVGAEVVLANSSIIRASETENPDVFFAVKGAASSFGIVTEFKVRTEPEPGSVVQYSYTFNVRDTASRAKTFKDWQALISEPDLTRKFSSMVIILEHTMIIFGTFFGTKAEFDSFQLQNRFPANQGANVTVIDDWLALVTNWATGVDLQLTGGLPSPFYSKSLNFRRDTLIPSATVDKVFKYLDKADKGTPIWFVLFDLEAGATNDVPVDATAYAHRDVLFWMQSYAIGLTGVSKTTKDFLNGLNNIITSDMSYFEFGAYPGYVDPELAAGQQAYWGPNLPRLERIKAEIDPHVVFHNPQSVKPFLAYSQ